MPRLGAPSAIRRALLHHMVVVAGIGASGLASPSVAQPRATGDTTGDGGTGPWPAKPVKLVVPTSPGGATDTLARAIAERLGRTWSQPVIVENRSGANQIIGGEYVARAAPDGYTLIISDASTFVINPFLYRQLKYDPLTAFAPVSRLVQVPWVVAVNAALPIRNVADLVAYARAHPGRLSYGSFGNGSSAHICVASFCRLAGIDMTHVPFKGSAPSLAALIAGEISMMMVTPLVVEPQVRTGRLRLIAATTLHRLQRMPALPTLAESGYAGFDAGTWFGILAPAGTPAEIVTRLHDDLAQITREPAFREQFIDGQWLIPVSDTPASFASYMKSDAERWRQLIEVSRVSVE